MTDDNEVARLEAQLRAKLAQAERKDAEAEAVRAEARKISALLRKHWSKQNGSSG